MLAFTARYFSGLPFQPAVTVMLREFLPGAKRVACNELQVPSCLCWGLRARGKSASCCRAPSASRAASCRHAGASAQACVVGRQVLPLLECHQGSTLEQGCGLRARQHTCTSFASMRLVHSRCIEQLRERCQQV